MISGKVHISVGEEKIHQMMQDYDGVIIWDLHSTERNRYLKYIEKLRKLIQIKISQNMTYRCDTGIMLGCQSCTVFLRIYAHTAEFTDLKGLSTQCKTVLKKKHRTSVVCFYRNRYDQHDR